jgi:hypothetical protein
VIEAEIVKSTANLDHSATNMVDAKANVVFAHTPLDRTDDRLNPNTMLEDQAIIGLLLIGY